MSIEAYYKRHVGSHCVHRGCHERNYLGSEINYIVSGETLCEEHAKTRCESYRIPCPLPQEFEASLSASQKEIFAFLKEHLRLVTRISGGCRAENCPADQDIYLVLGGQVISEVRIDF